MYLRKLHSPCELNTPWVGVLFSALSWYWKNIHSFFFFSLFLLVGGWLLYNIVVVFAIHWHESAMDVHVSPSRSPLLPPSPSHLSGSSQCTSPEHLSHASSLGWWSVSPLIVYLFQCYSLRTSHPCLLPQSPKVCSVYLCLFFCSAYRVIINIFLKSKYMC